ncbi:sugar ABC transporter ATP-binding protein [Streptomyces sp. NPDC058289]|uniref:sugar ABC transporter ATP-binding protein n=1 Tax=Streptomyces sp. NPDC058289 TaxID=3346425 RepID=UPI0036E18562
MNQDVPDYTPPPYVRADAGPEFAVQMRGISKAFSGVPILTDVDFDVHRGEVHALAGGNGAGKSTLMKILQGVHSLDAGEILISGRKVDLRSIHDAKAHGIGMVFQEFSLVPTLTVAQNIFLGREPTGAGGLIDDREAVRRSREIFTEMGVDIDPRAELAGIGTAYWQLTEIAKALAQDARVIIMDEPTAALAKHETETLFELIRRLQARGISIVYISHRMDEVYRIADRITVLRDGRKVITSPLALLTTEDIIEEMIGRRLEGAMHWQERRVDRSGTPLLEARNLKAGSRVQDISFKLYPGEIVGLAGLMGSGRTELAQCLFGIDPVEDGELLLRGRRTRIRDPRAAVSAGLALIPEDRRVQGLVLDHSVRDNLLLPLLSELRRGPLVNDRAGTELADLLIGKMGIKVASAAKPVRLLSGGNQQKVVIAKWLGTGPDVVIMDEPTAGVDIGTKTEIIAMIRQLADEGKAFLLISSELPELLAVSDRVLVLRDGTVDQELDRRDIPDEGTLQLAIQGAQS